MLPVAISLISAVAMWLWSQAVLFHMSHPISYAEGRGYLLHALVLWIISQAFPLTKRSQVAKRKAKG